MAKSPLKELPKIYHSISSEWKPEFIGNLCKIKTGSSDTQDKVENGEYPFYVRAEEVQRSNKYIFDGQGILTAGDGVGVGKVFHLVDGKIDFHQRVYLLHDFSQRINQRYLYEYFKLNFVRQVFRFTAKTSVDSVRMDMISKMSIPLPPLEEQAKIAEILSTWDKSIEATEKLLENSKKRKKALMQQLLTGKKRLPGFSGEWRESRLGQHFERVNLKNKELNQNVVTISAQRGFVSQQDFFSKQIASENLENYFLLKEGQFAYNKSYSAGYPMGATKRLKGFDKAVVTTLYICFDIKDHNYDSADYWEHFFESGILNKGLTMICQEGARAHGLLNVKPSDFFSLRVFCPSVGEQRSIAEVLDLASRLVAVQEQKLSSLKSEKQALMQQLLTGKKRVKVEATTA